MERSSAALASVIEYATQGSQPIYWLPALHILKTSVHGLLSTHGDPHPLLKYVSTGAIDFPTMLGQWYFSDNQRQAVLAAWELFNGGDRRDWPPVAFGRIYFGLDENNFRAVMDGMHVRTERDPGGHIQGRLLRGLLDILEEWKLAGL